MRAQTGDVNCYDVLQVHPAAPLDLITAVYWRLAGQVQSLRTGDPEAEAALWTITRAYETLANAQSRAEHDRAHGIEPQPIAPKVHKPRRRRRFMVGSRGKGDPGVDYYNILRVAPGAEQAVIEEAYEALRNFYSRLVYVGGAPAYLIDYLEEAYAVTHDPERRRLYDQARRIQPAVPTAEGKRPETTEAQTGAWESEFRTGTLAEREAVPEAGLPDVMASPQPEQESPEVQGESHQAPEPVETAPEPGPLEAAKQEPEIGPPARDEGPVEGPESSTAPRILPVAQGPEAREGGASARRTGREGPGEEAGKRGLPRIGHGATELFRLLTRQLSAMSAREAEQVQDVTSRRELDRLISEETEEVLLQRLWNSAASQLAEGTGSKPPTLVRLELVDGPGKGLTHDLDHFPLTIGGESGCDIVLAELKEHKFRLLYRDGRFIVYSLSYDERPSNGSDTAPWWILEDGDKIRLGPCTLRLTAVS